MTHSKQTFAGGLGVFSKNYAKNDCCRESCCFWCLWSWNFHHLPPPPLRYFLRIADVPPRWISTIAPKKKRTWALLNAPCSYLASSHGDWLQNWYGNAWCLKKLGVLADEFQKLSRNSQKSQPWFPSHWHFYWPGSTGQKRRYIGNDQCSATKSAKVGSHSWVRLVAFLGVKIKVVESGKF